MILRPRRMAIATLVASSRTMQIYWQLALFYSQVFVRSTLAFCHEDCGDQEKAAEETIDAASPKIASERAQDPCTNGGVAAHYAEVDGDHTARNEAVLRRESV